MIKLNNDRKECLNEENNIDFGYYNNIVFSFKH